LVEERQRCLDAGMNDHVSKPIDPDALFATLARWVKPRQEAASEPPPDLKRDRQEVSLPEIDGIDMAGGLKRVAGNRRLYRDLLDQFAARQADVAVQILAALERGDRELATRLAHTVKGVAGNLGIVNVHTAAEKVEKAIRDADPSVPVLLKQFASLIAPQVQAIVEGLRGTVPATPDGDTQAPFDPEAASAALAKLRALLEASDADAEEAFSKVRAAVGGQVEGAQIAALGASISEFDFEGALAKLDEIATACKLNGVQAAR
jgi:HPt (histidine-containing phosphotransfer) domain-containing protein